MGIDEGLFTRLCETYQPYPLSSKFRSLARNKYMPDYNEICKKYARRSQVYTYQNS